MINDDNIVETENHEKSDSTPRVIPADDLFHNDDEIWIEHNGEMYRLRITRRNKLILQK